MTFSNEDRFDVLGTSVDAVTVDGAIARVRDLVDTKTNGYVVFCTVSTVLSARDDAKVMTALDDAALVTPDGTPLVWLGRRASPRPVERVYGPDFMIDLLEATGAEFSHYFFGGRDGAAAEMAGKLMARFPSLRVAGLHEPALDLSLEDAAADIERINATDADLVWVGLGHPKQELWMHKHSAALTTPVALGVGAAFDFHAGRKKEAPRWMKRSGLQWLHRLVQEPRRLWRRYLLGNSRFVWLLLTNRKR